MSRRLGLLLVRLLLFDTFDGIWDAGLSRVVRLDPSRRLVDLDDGHVRLRGGGDTLRRLPRRRRLGFLLGGVHLRFGAHAAHGVGDAAATNAEADDDDDDENSARPFDHRSRDTVVDSLQASVAVAAGARATTQEQQRSELGRQGAGERAR
mmetsp:Transcript_5123/g.11691  ORF Transcript_5123/g.11691 Transcript_5123/m.11691 type:complete len:151 (-) Transcript_5123:147-599(-)